MSEQLSSGSSKAFFGDADYQFRITPSLVLELERATDAGIGALCRRLFRGDFRLADVAETIRLGLIGGGTPPQDAKRLTDTYLPVTPLTDQYSLAVTVLELLWFGDASTDETEGETTAQSEKESDSAKD